MEALQGKNTGQEDMMKKLQSQIGGKQSEGNIAQKQMKEARKNISPESKPPSELHPVIYKTAENIIKSPITVTQSIFELPKKIADPLLMVDRGIEPLMLNWKAKVKGFFSGIGSFFKSAFNSKSDKK